MSVSAEESFYDLNFEWHRDVVSPQKRGSTASFFIKRFVRF